MAVSITIAFKDADRRDVDVPFSVHSVMEDHWRPFAHEHSLPMIASFEHLVVTQLGEAEQLVAELHRARALLTDGQATVGSVGEYMLNRLELTISVLEDAIGRWGEVAEIVI